MCTVRVKVLRHLKSTQGTNNAECNGDLVSLRSPTKRSSVNGGRRPFGTVCRHFSDVQSAWARHTYVIRLWLATIAAQLAAEAEARRHMDVEIVELA